MKMFLNMCMSILFLVQVLITDVLGLTVDQTQFSLSKRKDRTAFIKCTVSGLESDNYVHWYQKKDGEAFKRILYISEGGNSFIPDTNHPENADFRVPKGSYELKVYPLKKSHSAVYYCACWDRGNWIKVFGSGTKLEVTDSSVNKPVVSTYLKSTLQPNGKQTMLCQAKGMFPDLVRFTWEDQNGKVSNTGGEVLEQRDDQEVSVTSMLIINQQSTTTNKYICKVKHESGETTTEVKEQESESKQTVTGPAPTCSPSQEIDQKHINDESGFSRSLYLFRVTYAMLLVKNVLYFFSVSVILYKRRAWNKESS